MNVKRYAIPVILIGGIFMYFAIPASSLRGLILIGTAISLLAWGIINRERGTPPWKCPRCLLVMTLALALIVWGGVVMWAYSTVL